MVPECFGYFLEYREFTGTPRESNGPTWAIGEREGSPQGVVPPLGRTPRAGLLPLLLYIRGQGGTP